MLQQLNHLVIVSLDTFGDLGLALIVTDFLSLPTTALYYFLKARALNRWEREFIAWDRQLADEENQKDLAFATLWAERFPAWTGLTRDQLIRRLPNTTNPHFIDRLAPTLHTAPATSESPLTHPLYERRAA